jgi:hypothetical protein
MLQQVQLFRLKTRSPDGETLWAYRYRVGGARVQTMSNAADSRARMRRARHSSRRSRPCAGKPLAVGHL